MTFAAMEPPVSFEPDRLRDEKAKALRATEICEPNQVVRGQYVGYRDEPGVAKDSDDRDLLRDGARDRQLAVGRRAVLPADREEA